jgi:cytochrome P450
MWRNLTVATGGLVSDATKSLDEIPMLSGPLFMGNLREFQRDWLGMLQRMYRECGEIGRFRLGPRQAVVWGDPELVAEILITKAQAFDKGPLLRGVARTFMGDGLLTIRQKVHANSRAQVASAFHPRRFDGYVALMVEAISDIQSRMVPGSSIDVHEEMMHVAIYVIGRTLFSTDIRESAGALERVAEHGLEYINHRIRHPLSMPYAIPTARNRQAKWARRELDGLIGALIEKRRTQPVDREDVLSILMDVKDDNGQPLSARALRDHLVTFLLAGFETVASALSWTWALLAEHPKCEARVREELEGVLGGGLPTREKLESLVYCQQVLKEAMRLYPPGHTLGRSALQDVQIGPYFLPAGTVSIISPYQLHRNPRLFRSPESFDPGRFGPKRAGRLPRCAYLPFGAGPRVCIGARFSMLEALAVLALTARRFRFVMDGPGLPVPQTLMTLRPASFRATVHPA